jgi:hypothetical protein
MKCLAFFPSSSWPPAADVSAMKRRPRDNRADGGGVSYAWTTVTINAAAGAFATQSCTLNGAFQYVENLIFQNGFESGDTSLWSGMTP